MDSVTAQQVSSMILEKTCSHGRLIDDVLTRNGKRTGKVHCVECGAKFDDPYHGLK
ncbi:MAG: hypothetical protein H8J66_00250 [Nitrospira sp.]|nr:hypothetical protein [Nitrospira sp.]